MRSGFRLRIVIAFTIVACVGVTMDAAAAEPALIGAPSCSTATCHGGVIGLGPAWHHSLSTWMAKDPHAGAGLLLRDADSRRIVSRLNPSAADSRDVYDNVLRERCISCHVTVAADETSIQGRLDDSLLAQGVSCESCHGPAGSWLDSHVQMDWSGQKRFASETGMRDTESIIGRSETCVRCHIGSRSDDGMVRDMNHDLIAAGHPALRFDLLLYSENLPRHWDSQSDAEIVFHQSAIRTRNVGRAMNLASAAKLSAERATAHLNDAGVPWPELADYDCFACHQSLSMREYLLPPTGKVKSPLHVSDGLPIWNAWHTINQVKLSRNVLEILSPQRSDPARIAEQCQKLSDAFRKTAQVRMTEQIDPTDTRDKILQQIRSSAPVDWHQAAIQYLDIDAALTDLSKDESTQQESQRMIEAIRKLERRLRFEPDRQPTDEVLYQSPATFDPEAYRTLMLKAIGPIESNHSDSTSGQPVSDANAEQR